MAPDRGSDESAEVFWGGSPSAPRHSTATDIGNIGELQDGGAGASGIPESAGDSDEGEQADHHLLRQYSSRNDGRKYPEFHDAGGRSFTLRGVVVGLGVGVLISFSNTYLGLQSGWVSGMTMPASLIGFAIFKVMAKHLSYPFTPVEHVLIQTVASSVGTMPLAAGFVGVIPAIEFLLQPEEGGPIHISLPRLVIWGVGLSVFGAFFAVPLRKEVIIREKLRFPSGTATALLIKVLHGNRHEPQARAAESDAAIRRRRKIKRRSEDYDRDQEESNSLLRDSSDREADASLYSIASTSQSAVLGSSFNVKNGWISQIRLLIFSFIGSGIYTLLTYFVPILRKLPVFGRPLAKNWLWTLNPSPAYVGQGIIMGSTTTMHMLFGAIVGWGVLSPLAKTMEWAPGPVSSWEDGSKGWIIWISLAIMLADSIVSLGWLVLRPLFRHGPRYFREMRNKGGGMEWRRLNPLDRHSSKGAYASLPDPTRSASVLTPHPSHSSQPPKRVASRAGLNAEDEPEPDAPPGHLISTRTVTIGLLASLGLCIITVHLTFPGLIPFYATVLSLLLALPLSIMGVRALGETDLNPVSGISKITQLFFALLITSTSASGTALINLVAGAISEAGALQAGDMMQDLKTGHILGASPKAQFYGQLIGGFVGSIVSALVYRMYTTVYEVPGELFQIPTGFLWIFTARLVTGSGLPHMAWQWSVGAFGLFAILTAIRIVAKERGATWHKWVPGGIAVAVGMYNVPSFTLARTVGGLLHLYWVSYSSTSPLSTPFSWFSHKRRNKQPQDEHEREEGTTATATATATATEDNEGNRDETPVVVLASGLILGEGVVSIVNLTLASLKVAHL